MTKYAYKYIGISFSRVRVKSWMYKTGCMPNVWCLKDKSGVIVKEITI